MCADESTRQPWKHCLWWFLSRQLHSFRRRFLSQQGLCARKNPGFNCGGTLVDGFWFDIDSVFACVFRVNKDFVRWRIHATTMEAVSLMVSESAATQLSVTSSESTWTVCADESRPQLWRQSRWCFLRQQRLSFPLRVRSQQGIYVPSNPGIGCGVSLVDYFWVNDHLVFDDDYRVNRECVRRWNQALGGEAVSVAISEPRVTQFSELISESSGTVCTDESKSDLGTQCHWLFLSQQRLSFRFRFQSQHGLCALTNPRVSLGSTVFDGFWVGSYTAFGDDFRVNRDCVRGRIQALAGDAVSFMLSESAATQFSLAISESTGTLWDDKSMRQLWKQCRWLFLSLQLLSIRWRLPSQQGLCARTNPGFSCEGSLVHAF